MIVLAILLVAMLGIAIVALLASVAWPILLVAALLLAADIIFFKFVFGRKKE